MNTFSLIHILWVNFETKRILQCRTFNLWTFFHQRRWSLIKLLNKQVQSFWISKPQLALFKFSTTVWRQRYLCTTSHAPEDMYIVRRCICGTWWRIGRVEAFWPEGHGFESRSRHHVGTLGKSLTHSCLWRFGVKLRHSIRAMSRALLSSSELEEAL